MTCTDVVSYDFVELGLIDLPACYEIISLSETWYVFWEISYGSWLTSCKNAESCWNKVFVVILELMDQHR